MKLFRVSLLLVCLGLGACITTTTGDVPVVGSNAEVAKVNMNLGIEYMQQGNYEEAMVKLRRSIDVDNDNATAHWALGLVYERLGDPEGAEKEFRTAAKQGPDDPEALNQLASFLCRQGDNNAGLKYYDRALKIPLNSNRYAVATNAGVCAKQVDLERAENYLRKALEINPNYPDALYQMADVSYREEKYLQARAFVERRLSAAPATPSVYWLGYQVEVGLQDEPAANKYARLIVNEFPDSSEVRLLREAQSDGN